MKETRTPTLTTIHRPAKVVILGATSAIAAQLAQRLAARGHPLYLVGRNAQKLELLCASLGDAVAGKHSADLDDLQRNHEHIERASACMDGLDVAIIAHGLLGDQLESERALQTAQQTIQTNFLSPVSLVIPLANRFEAQGHGTLVVLSSVAGVRGRPRNYTYGSAKSALTTYLQGVRSRLWRRGVEVHTFALGPVDTPMTHDHAKNALFAQPEEVARAILLRMGRRGRDWYVPWYWAPIMLVVRNLPEWLFQRLGFLSGR